MKGLSPGHACACAKVTRTRADRVRQAAAALNEDPACNARRRMMKIAKMKSVKPRTAAPGKAAMARPRSGDLVLFLLIFVVLLKLVVLLVERIDVDTLENGKRQRFAEQVAIGAHPEAFDGIVADFRNRQWLPARFQHHDVAWFQFHDLFLRLKTFAQSWKRHRGHGMRQVVHLKHDLAPSIRHAQQIAQF
jgi:hypothetical protein